MRQYNGLLFLGDPHVSDRVVGRRRADYGERVGAKLQEAIDLCQENEYLPVILGDLFHVARDNPNRLIVKLLELFSGIEVLGVYGNHDVHLNTLEDHDSLQILAQAQALTLLTPDKPWMGEIGGRRVRIVGFPWHTPLGARMVSEPDEFVIAITHHDLAYGGAGEARRLGTLKEWEGVHLVVNGHQHRPAAESRLGSTLWTNPGGMTRVAWCREERNLKPAVSLLTFVDGEPVISRHELKCAGSWEEIFEPSTEEPPSETEPNISPEHVQAFRDLRRRDATGAAFIEFMKLNMSNFSAEVQSELWLLMERALPNSSPRPTEAHDLPS